MVALVVLGSLIGLAVLGPLFGRDSRPRPSSEEEVLAARGFSWRS